MKKHISAFTPVEKAIVENKLQAVKSLEKCQHCIDRMQEKKISPDEMMRVFSSFNIIEYHLKNRSHRVLIRGNINEKGRNICLVVDIITGSIVTAYTNRYDDHHSTLRHEEYDWTVDLEKILS